MQMMGGAGSVNRPGLPMQQQGPAVGQQPPPAPPPGSPPGTVLMTRGQLTFQLGQMMRAQVEEEPQPGLFNLAFGDQELLATANAQLSVGDQILLRVTGQDQQNVNLQLVRTEQFSEMSDDDVSGALMNLDVQPQESNMALAKGMVEMGLPLTQQDFQELQQALARMPDGNTGNSQDITSAAFLKQAQLPMTPDNISTMSNFISQNPQLGAQLYEVSQSLKKLGQELEGDAPKDLAELLQKVPGLVGEMTLTPGRPPKRKPSQNLHNMAFQSGIEGMLPFVNSDDQWDLLKLMQQLRQGLADTGANSEQAATAEALLKGVEDNLAAQKLVNRSESEKLTGLYYLQVPVRFHDENTTAEVRIEGYRNQKGEPMVDPQNLRVEVAIHTRHLGQVGYLLSILGGQVDVLTSAEDDATRELMEQSLPHLVNKLAALGYTVTNARCKLADLEQSPITPIIQKQTFEKMERINIRA